MKRCSLKSAMVEMSNYLVSPSRRSDFFKHAQHTLADPVTRVPLDLRPLYTPILGGQRIVFKIVIKFILGRKPPNKLKLKLS